MVILGFVRGRLGDVESVEIESYLADIAGGLAHGEGAGGGVAVPTGWFRRVEDVRGHLAK